MKANSCPVGQLESMGIKLKEFEVIVATVNAVMKYDIEAINAVITKHKPQCQNAVTNFNLSISGNGKIFKRVLYYCGKSLLDDKKAF
ncbi:MAG: hypothetical protein MRQ13_03235 [Candidatus Midichloria sp.]|nr:hypothetical protein [Candidatus Midichloria sp.]